jgi:glycosyltransferase involved in cell wall biosynthesis
MRVCLVSYEFMPKTAIGGAAALYTDLANALAKSGHEVTVFSGNPHAGLEIEQNNGVRNIRFGTWGPRPRLLACSRRAFDVARRYRKEIAQSGHFDIIESPELAAEPLIIKVLRRDCPTMTRLITPHFMLYSMNQREPLVLVDWLEKTNADLSNLILCDSRTWGRDIINHWRIPESRLRTCPLGIDLSRVDNTKQVPLPIEDPYILFAGRMTLAKGPQILAAAAPAIHERHPEVKFAFAGMDTKLMGGEAVSEMMKRSVPPDVSKSFVFLGFVKSWDLLVTLYRNAAVCVKADVRSNHSFDTMGQMACERTLVCTRTEGTTDMIEHGLNGYFFDREKPAQLSEIINTLLGDSGQSKTIGRKARETIERGFTSQQCAKETVKFYEEAITESTDSHKPRQ